MFEHLTSQLETEVRTSLKVLAINEAMRDIFVSRHDFLSEVNPALPADADDTAQTIRSISHLIPDVPDKVDWQVYDHCAAVTRIYAVYERFVGDLVGEYVRMLPRLYGKYSDLPLQMTKQHRRGIGHILLKLGETGLYKNIEEEAVVAQLASGLSGASSYTLLTEAFFIDRQNLRLEVLTRLFSSLGFQNVGQFIENHAAVVDFIDSERPEGSTADKELQTFVGYRNEAAHKKVENLLSKDEMGATGRFVCALGHALADLVKHEVYRRHLALDHYLTVCNIAETHHEGRIVIGVPAGGVTVRSGDEIILWSRTICRPATIESIQLDGTDMVEFTGDGAREIGLRLSAKAPATGELRRLVIPAATPKEIQLELREAMPSLADAASRVMNTYKNGGGVGAVMLHKHADRPTPVRLRNANCQVGVSAAKERV